MIAVDIEAVSRWYRHVFDASSGHGGTEYEQLLVEGWLITQSCTGLRSGIVTAPLTIPADSRKRCGPMVRNS